MSVSVCAVGEARRGSLRCRGLPDAALLVDEVVLVVVVGLERCLLVVVGTAAEQLLPVVNLHDRRRGFLICSLHNCISFLFLFDDYLEFRSSSIKHERWGRFAQNPSKSYSKSFVLRRGLRDFPLDFCQILRP